MTRRFLLSGLLAVGAFAQMHIAVAQSTNSAPFPRLGGYLIGGSVQSAFATASYQQQVAKLGAAVIATYPGWSTGGFSNQSAAAAVKAINPSIKLTLYSIPESPPTSASGAYATLWNDINNANQWLRTDWPSGSIVQHDGANEANMTTYSAHNSSGQNYPVWRAAYDAAYATSNWDGIYVDNFNWTPLVNGDFMQDGSSQTAASMQQNYRNGYAAYVNGFRSSRPGSQVWANVATWGQGGANLSGYNQLLNGGVMESIIGQSYSYESQGWTQMMTYYRNIMSYTTPGGYQIFEQDGTASDYQGMRYGLASCLMDNGYYYFNVTGPGGGGTITWFDEFNASLGAATSNPATTAWQNGVYRRDFANGIALVNPKGNGTRTVTLETSYKHLSGSQAPSVNNGQTVTTVTLNDRDGVILLRTTAQAVPDAPTLTVQ